MSRLTRFRGLFGPDPGSDVDDELSFHIDMRVRELIEAGESPERARERALRRFGDMASPRHECVTIMARRGRSMARRDYVAELRQDVAYAFRSLVKRPGFTLVAVLTLALGIGANSAIFSVVNGVLLQGLPYPDAGRLYLLQMIYPDATRYSSLSAPDFMSVSEQATSFEEIGAFDLLRSPVVGVGEPREVAAAALSENLLRMLDLRLAAGRGFAREEHEPGGGDVAILDYGFWQREFGGSADALGSTFIAAGRTYRVVGVLAQAAKLPEPVDLVVPITYDEEFSATAVAGRRSEYLTVIGRARPGLTEEQVAGDVLNVSQRLAAEFPDTNGRLTMGVVSLRESVIGDVRRPLLILLGAVGFVLLVACANVANLLLARASARQSELAVRSALGAGRGRLVRQLLTESVVLAAAGGVAGLLLAWYGVRALVAARPADIPRLDTVAMDGTVVLVTLSLTLLTGLLFGAIPAIQATRRDAGQALREGGRGTQGGAGQRVRSGLVITEMALAVVLLVGAGLLLRSFAELTRVDAGFRPEGAVSFRIAMDRATYPEGQHIRDFTTVLLERLEAVPGATAVAGTGVLPLSGRGALINFDVQDAPPPPDDVNREIGYHSVTPGYFATIGARVVRGRDFGRQDHNTAPPVALINETGARFWFGGEDPLGRFVQIGPNTREIVGIVSDVLQRGPATPAMPQLYAPYEQSTTRSLQIVVRASGDPMALAPTLRTLLRSLDPTMPIGEFAPLERVAAEAVSRPRFYSTLLALFAASALALAAIGIFGVMSYSVAQRAREISIRMALGARRADVVAMIVGRSMILAGAGLAIGLLGAAAVGRVLSSQLYNVGILDPITMAAAAVVLAGSALAASWLPARRAAGLDPGTALRES
jgi:putative ABC transport system permease protein